MKNWKKRMGFLALVLALLVVFAACAEDEAPAPPAEDPPQVDTPPPADPPPPPEDGDDRPFEGRTLILGIWGGNDAEQAAIHQVAADFEEMTGATIEWRLYTDYNVQIQADFAAGIAPDAFYVDSSMAEFFASLGVLEPLDRAFFDADAFYENVLNAFVFDGVLYAIPKDQSSLARYVNVGLLNQVGFELSDIPADVESYLEFLPELQAALDAEFGPNAVMAASGVYEPARVLHWINRGGAQPVTPDGRSNLSDPAVVAHLEFIKSLFDTGAMRTPAQMGAGWNGEAFGSELTVIMEEGNWVYRMLRNEFAHVDFTVIDMPTYQGVGSSMVFTVGWGIYSESDNIDLAAEWVRFKTGYDGMYTWTLGAGPLPTRADVAERLSVHLSPELNMHIAQIPGATPWVMGMFTSIIADAYMNFMPVAMDGDMSVADAMAQADEQANMEIDFR